MQPLVSILVPVYNVERYIERCARSVFDQTYNNLEIIFVDDCTPDHSISILHKVLNEYTDRKSQTKIIKHDKNLGSATSRNTALKASTGEYIMYCDGDDWMDRENVERMLTTIHQGGHCIVYSNYYNSYSTKEKLIEQNCGTSNEGCLVAMLSGQMQCMMWNKIFKRSLYFDNNIFFVDGADMHEDVGVVLRLFAVADSIGYLPEAYYHYNQCNTSSILRSAGNKQKRRRDCLQRIKNVDIAIKFLKDHHVWAKDIQRAAADCELRAKNELVDETSYSLKKWIATFPEADKAIWRSPFLTLNMRFLFTWLHFHQIWLYKLQKRVTDKINS